MNALNDAYTLANGVKIPCVGFGTWQSAEGEVAYGAVRAALDAGYRHIDTAEGYGNEKSVGRAVRESGVPREEIFVTSKIKNPCRGYEKTLAAFDKTMEDLGFDVLDLLLIHWPASHHRFENWEEINLDTWKAMTELYKAGRVRAIGVSNFCPHHLRALMETEVKPMVDQIELHPGLMQEDTVSYCRENGVLVEAYSPLGTGRMLANETLADIAAKLGRSTAQVCIRWSIQHGILPLPKSVTPARIAENAKVFDFVIPDEDMAVIDALPNFGGSGLHPDTVNF